MVEIKKNSAVEEALALFEQLFGPAPDHSLFPSNFGCSDMENAIPGPASDAFESVHVFSILQAVRKRLLQAGKTVYHLCN